MTNKIQLGEYAEGDYQCVCLNCKTQFVGDKRATSCLPCAVNTVKNELSYLKLQAQTWAMEAKAQRVTVHECLQAASGATGEKADWNGSKPVRDELGRLRAIIKYQQRALEFIERWAVYKPFKAKASGNRTTAEEILSIIQFCPPIKAITDSMMGNGEIDEVAYLAAVPTDILK